MPEVMLMGECPMTFKNVEKYKITDKELKKFCSYGCCPLCGKLFLEEFGSRVKE